MLFEDDASPEPDFMRVIEQLLEVPEQWDVVKLSGFHNPYVIHSNHLINGYVYGVPTTRHCNTAAVLYNRKAAQQFIECMLPMSLPFDHALEQPWLYDVKLRVVKPSPVQAGDGAESTIVGTKAQKFKWYQRLSTYVFRLKNEVCDEKLAAATRGIDVILGGHSHTFMEKPAFCLNAEGKSIPVLHTGRSGIFVVGEGNHTVIQIRVLILNIGIQPASCPPDYARSR